MRAGIFDSDRAAGGLLETSRFATSSDDFDGRRRAQEFEKTRKYRPEIGCQRLVLNFVIVFGVRRREVAGCNNPVRPSLRVNRCVAIKTRPFFERARSIESKIIEPCG